MGNKVFGGAILRKSDLSLINASTNRENDCPLWHGETTAIRDFYVRRATCTRLACVGSPWRQACHDVCTFHFLMTVCCTVRVCSGSLIPHIRHRQTS